MANKNDEKYYMGNPKLPMSNQNTGYTEEQLIEIAKCEKSIVYFAETFFTIKELDRGKQLIKLRPYQKRLLKAIKDNRFTVCLSARQSGKCVEGQTEITVRNKKTGEIMTLPIEEFHQKFVA